MGQSDGCAGEPDKVHVVVVYSRYDADDELIRQFDSLYIVTRADGRWGIRATRGRPG